MKEIALSVIAAVQIRCRQHRRYKQSTISGAAETAHEDKFSLQHTVHQRIQRLQTVGQLSLEAGISHFTGTAELISIS